MLVIDAESAREWLAAWGPKAFTLRRAERLAAERRILATAVRLHSPQQAVNFDACAGVLELAIAEQP